MLPWLFILSGVNLSPDGNPSAVMVFVGSRVQAAGKSAEGAPVGCKDTNPSGW